MTQPDLEIPHAHVGMLTVVYIDGPVQVIDLFADSRVTRGERVWTVEHNVDIDFNTLGGSDTTIVLAHVRCIDVDFDGQAILDMNEVLLELQAQLPQRRKVGGRRL